MPPMHSGDTGDGQADDGDEFRPPLPPEDRIWRHPSEVAASSAMPDARSAGGEGRRGPRAVGLVLVSGLIGATLSLGVVAALGGFERKTTVVERSVAVQPVTSADADGDSVAAIASRTRPAVAAVRVERDGTWTAANAIVLRSDGHLLTNAHVIDGADSIDVRLHDGSATSGTVVGLDPVTDLAVLRVDARPLEPAALGTAGTVSIGDRVLAVGMVDSGGWSSEVTTALVRGLDRRVRLADGTDLHDMILVDAPLVGGIAGAPLLDAGGAVVGITSVVPPPADDALASSRPDEEIGAAIPIDLAQRIADQIIEHGHPRHVWLGVEGSDLPPEEAAELGVAGGASIARVTPGSPAAEAGLVDGDVIVAVDADAVDSMTDLIAALRIHEPDDEVTMFVRRGDETLSIRVVLAEKRA